MTGAAFLPFRLLPGWLAGATADFARRHNSGSAGGSAGTIRPQALPVLLDLRAEEAAAPPALPAVGTYTSRETRRG